MTDPLCQQNEPCQAEIGRRILVVVIQKILLGQ